MTSCSSASTCVFSCPSGHRHRRGSCGRLWPGLEPAVHPHPGRPLPALMLQRPTCGRRSCCRVGSGSRRIWPGLSALLPSPSWPRLGSSTDADTRPPPSTSRPARILVSIPPSLFFSPPSSLPRKFLPPFLPPSPPHPPPLLAPSFILSLFFLLDLSLKF